MAKHSFMFGGCKCVADVAKMSEAQRAELAKQIYDAATPEQQAASLVNLDSAGNLDKFLAATRTNFEDACRSVGLFNSAPAKEVKTPVVTRRDIEIAEQLSESDLLKLLQSKGML